MAFSSAKCSCQKWAECTETSSLLSEAGPKNCELGRRITYRYDLTWASHIGDRDMKLLLFLVQMALWIGSGIWLVDYFRIESIVLKMLVFGVTGVAAMVACTFIASKVGFVPPLNSADVNVSTEKGSDV